MQTADLSLPDLTRHQLIDAKSMDFVHLVALLAAPGGPTTIRRLSDEMDVRRVLTTFLDTRPRSIHRDLITNALERLHRKADVGTIAEPAWAAPLAAIKPFADAFIDVARPQTLIGKLTTANRVPFNVSVPVASSGGTYRWTGEGAPKPVGNLSLSSVTVPVSKASGILVVTEELVQVGTQAAVAALRREMIRGMSAYLDSQLTDPTVAAVPNVSPASITHDAPSIPSSGTSADNALTDIKALIAQFTATNPNVESMALLMSPAVATALAVASGSQTLTPNGGALYGIPVHTSSAVGSRVIALDVGALLLADDGGLDVTISRNGVVEMSTEATSPPDETTVHVSLWQHNLVGLKIDRFISWRMARPSSVLYTNVAYI